MSNLQDVGRWLVYDPRFIDPSRPSGFWLCASPEDVYTIKINAGCIPADGSWDYLGRCEPFFSQFSYVLIVCPDPVRRADMVQAVRTRLQSTILLVAEDKAFRGCTSVGELKATYGIKAVDQILFHVSDLPAYGLLDLADVEKPDISGMEKVVSGIKGLDRAIGGFMMGGLSVWTGKRGCGKSTLIGQLLLESIDQGMPVCAYSGELPAWQFKYWTLLQAAGSKYIKFTTDKISGKEIPDVTHYARGLIEEWWRARFLLYDIGSSTRHDADNILRVFSYAHRRYGARVFLVDNLMTARFSGRERDIYRAQSDFAGELASFAKSNNVHIHLIAHPRKGDNIDDADDVGGSGDVTNAADNVFSLERILDDDRKHDSFLTILKNRFFGELDKGIGLNFDQVSKRFYKSGSGNPDKPYGWQFMGDQIPIIEDTPEEDPFAARGA